MTRLQFLPCKGQLGNQYALSLHKSAAAPTKHFSTCQHIWHFLFPFLAVSTCDARSLIGLTSKFIHRGDLIAADWDILKVGRVPLLLLFHSAAQRLL